MYLVANKTLKNPFYHPTQIFADPDTLPYLIRKLRINRNYSRQAFALKTGVSVQYLEWIEKGKKPPSLKFCLTCGDLFGANPYWIKRKWYQETLSRIKRNLEDRLGLI
jgi:transcriptional regulator with XRE-family HTH domain